MLNKTAASFAILLFSPLAIYAQQTESSADVDDSSVEVVVVTGVRIGDTLKLGGSQVSQPGVDNSDLLRLFPGGNRNSNGPITGISQYRGLFGAQNNVSINGQAYTSGCPNWMVTPLSSIPRSQTQTVTLHRGLGSVALIEEGLGGSIAMSAREKGFSEHNKWSTFGRVEGGYGSNAGNWGGALYTGIHNPDNWFDVAASSEKGDDYKFAGGTVAATEYDRKQYRLGYGHRFSKAELTLGVVINRTGNSGTPALPMDIVYFDSEQYELGLDVPAGQGEISFKAHTLSVEHVMDNFTLRPIPANMAGMKMPRESLATGDGGGFKLTYARNFAGHDLLLGIDYKKEIHDADISNPMNEVFYITNFNQADRDRTGFFAQVTRPMDRWILEVGLRYNHLNMDSGEVGGNLAMKPVPMMSMTQQDRLDALAKAFNEADRSKTDHQLSGILKASSQRGENIRLNLGIGRKVRSPSYQERYLWLPMEATAGLADGYTYIGDINLKPETSIELTTGVDWSVGSFKLTPEVFYRDVKNYIQGAPSSNMIANKFAMMMSGRAPLQYANVDAELYGLDLGYELKITNSWMLHGNLGYVRGKRTDVKGNLYRIAPLSSFVELMYKHDRYFVSVESLAASKQDKVSAYNNEKATAGWGIASFRGGLSLGGNFDVSLGVENIFDKVFQDHLGGYNRVAGSDVLLRERLYSKGRNYYISLNANW